VRLSLEDHDSLAWQIVEQQQQRVLVANVIGPDAQLTLQVVASRRTAEGTFADQQDVPAVGRPLWWKCVGRRTTRIRTMSCTGRRSQSFSSMSAESKLVSSVNDSPPSALPGRIPGTQPGHVVQSTTAVLGCMEPRRRPESNRCTRLCRPLRSHSATAPERLHRRRRPGSGRVNA
jgi:hypothetical protein